MPIINTLYKPPYFFRNSHTSTIYSGLVRKVNNVCQVRERIVLQDSDFIDLDWSYSSTKSDSLLIVLHGLEGNAQRPYMLGMAKLFTENKVNVVCVNFRGCSGEPNLLYRSYHSGATTDLHETVQHIIKNNSYKKIYIAGFSLGGNLALKFLGESKRLPTEIKAGVAISVPCDLYGSMLEIHKPKNVLYARRFKKHLLEKLWGKQQIFPYEISKEKIRAIVTLKDFDDAYTAPAHGFKNALDYYKQSSSLQFLSNISLPTLIINARNDSFLSDSCFPLKQASQNPFIHLEIPNYGGHVGFYGKSNLYYNEKRALEFIKSLNVI